MRYLNKKMILTFAVILWMGVIFSFSAAPADESGSMSLNVGRIIGRVVVKDFDTWTEAQQEDFANSINYPVRKCAHATEYAVLGALLISALGCYKIGSRRQIIFAIVIGVLYACSDEFHQIFVPGRAGRVMDVMIDSAGLIVGIGVMRMVNFFYTFSAKNPAKSLDKPINS